MFGNNSNHFQFQNCFGPNMEIASSSQSQSRNNQRCNYNQEDFSSFDQNMYQNEEDSYNISFYNYGEQPIFEQNGPSFTYNFDPNEDTLYDNQNYPQFNTTNRRSGNLNRGYVMPTMDANQSSNQFYNASSFQANNSYNNERRQYIQPISESEYEREKDKEIRIERSNMTSSRQKTFFGQILDSIF